VFPTQWRILQRNLLCSPASQKFQFISMSRLFLLSVVYLISLCPFTYSLVSPVVIYFFHFWSSQRNPTVIHTQPMPTLLYPAESWCLVDRHQYTGGTCCLQLQVFPKCWCLSTKLHSITSQKTVIFIATAVRTSNFTCLQFVYFLSVPHFKTDKKYVSYNFWDISQFKMILEVCWHFPVIWIDSLCNFLLDFFSWSNFTAQIRKLALFLKVSLHLIVCMSLHSFSVLTALLSKLFFRSYLSKFRFILHIFFWILP
jgi:hypothetical protein